MSNINSFSQNINQIVENSANALSMVTALQEAMTSNETFVTYDYTDANGQVTRFRLPSYDAIINRLKAVEESINALQTGRGTINLTDGSRRTVQLNSIPHTPNQITGLEDPSTFTLDSNWFFEELMFPGAKVSVDLTGQIEDSADRVEVVRVILDAETDAAQTIWQDDLSINSYDYATLKLILENNGVRYYEDVETVNLPLVSNTASGLFQIMADPIITNGQTWYQLDSIEYSTISENGEDQGRNNILSIGDKLSYRESIYEVVDVDQNNLKVRLKRISGVDALGAFAVLSYFQDPFRSKILGIRFGAHEYNIIYFKGINEAHNLLANEWSSPIKFSSDELVLAGSSALQNTTFSDYYNRYIVDWGAEMIAEAKEASISAWRGTKPNAPVLNGEDLRVTQINTQINAAIDTTDVKNIAAEIESVKSQISSLKSTIAAQKTDLQSAVANSTHSSIQQQIDTNTNELKTLQTQYTSLVESFQSIVRENSAVTTLPKYHIRGFFPIPEYQYTDENETIPEEIIGFDIAYRYIREDNTGVPLATYSYTNTDGTEITGTFSDWNIEQSPMKTKVYDSDLGRYVWRSENVADGSEVNINQIDIPISKGEKVEIKVRSISEAGYPKNPLRSNWSNTVIIDFPDTLATGNEIADLITKINDDALNITIDNTLDAVGITAHLSDTVTNTNSVTGEIYKHLAQYIGYEDKRVTGEDGATTIVSMSVQDKIESLEIVSDDSSILIAKNSSDISAINVILDTKISDFEENINNLLTGLSQTDSSVRIHDIKFNKILDENYNVITQRVRFKTKIEAGGSNEAYEAIVGGIGVNPGSDNIYVFGENINEVKDLHVTDLQVHYVTSALNNGTVYSLNDRLNDISTQILNTSSLSMSLDTSMRYIFDNVHDYASKSVDIARLDRAVSEISTNLYTIKDGSDTMNVFADDLTVGYPYGGTRLTSNKMSGQLYVFDSNSDEMLGDVHCAELVYYNGGIVGGEIRKLSNIIETLDTTVSDFEEVQENYNETKKLVDKILQYDGVNTYTVYADEAEFKTVRTGKVISDEYQVTSENGFWAIHSEALGNVVSGNFSNVFLYATDTNNSQSAPTSGTNRIDVLQYLLKHQEDLESLNSWMDLVKSTIKTDEYGSDATVDAVFGDFNEVQSIVYGFKSSADKETDYSIRYANSNIVVMSNESDCGNIVAKDLLIRNTPGEAGVSVISELKRLQNLDEHIYYDIENGNDYLEADKNLVISGFTAGEPNSLVVKYGYLEVNKIRLDANGGDLNMYYVDANGDLSNANLRNINSLTVDSDIKVGSLFSVDTDGNTEVRDLNVKGRCDIAGNVEMKGVVTLNGINLSEKVQDWLDMYKLIADIQTLINEMQTSIKDIQDTVNAIQRS